MKVYSIFRSGHFLVLLCLFTVEGKKSPTGKHTCRKGLLSQVTENLYIKATSLKSSIPKDLIKNTRLLKKTTKMLFMTNCGVRDQLLSFYVKNVFSHLGAGSDKLYVVNAFQVLQANMNACVSIFLRAKLTVQLK
ncbi:Interleukin-26, partial [Tauraco erythrolophus]